MSFSWPLAGLTAIAAAFGINELRRAFKTGRALGRFGMADRATRPVQFWVNVTVLVALVTVPST